MGILNYQITKLEDKINYINKLFLEGSECTKSSATLLEINQVKRQCKYATKLFCIVSQSLSHLPLMSSKLNATGIFPMHLTIVIAAQTFWWSSRDTRTMQSFVTGLTYLTENLQSL
jgi:hypothetical protein